jgi:DNA-binding NtrC family response regulator
MTVCARGSFHVLIVGESGSGKELAAQAIHRLSCRAARNIVADNIAAIPASLASALLFGNKKHFPNPGMEDREGLIGAAHGSTLLLDEIGDMPEHVQPVLLRVLEPPGEYVRLGEEGRPRRSDFRLVAVTNRPERLRHELKRRFQREIRVPGIAHRKEDIPLLVRHLLVSQAQSQNSDASRFVQDGEPRLHPLLIEQLVHHQYTTHVSEIAFLLGKSMTESKGDRLQPLSLELPRGPQQLFAQPSEPQRAPPRPLPTRERAQQALMENGGDITRTALALNISRDQLNRLIRREGLLIRRRPHAALE